MRLGSGALERKRLDIMCFEYLTAVEAHQTAALVGHLLIMPALPAKPQLPVSQPTRIPQ
jgi:hypothetical protein